MKISIYAPYAKESFETARQRSFLHPERSVTLATDQVAGSSHAGRTMNLKKRAGSCVARIRIIVREDSFDPQPRASLPEHDYQEPLDNGRKWVEVKR